MLSIIYPHIEKVAGQPARLQRIPRVRVAQIVIDDFIRANLRSRDRE